MTRGDEGPGRPDPRFLASLGCEARGLVVRVCAFACQANKDRSPSDEQLAVDEELMSTQSSSSRLSAVGAVSPCQCLYLLS